MLNLDPAKLLVIFVIALVVLGPERLPKVARQMAGLWREFAKVREQISEEVRSAIPDVDIPRLSRIPSPSGAVAGLFARGSGAASAPSAPPRAGAVGAAGEPEPGPAGGDDRPHGRVAPRVVVHPTLGDVAFLPDDPSMN